MRENRTCGSGEGEAAASPISTRLSRQPRLAVVRGDTETVPPHSEAEDGSAPLAAAVEFLFSSDTLFRAEGDRFESVRPTDGHRR